MADPTTTVLVAASALTSIALRPFVWADKLALTIVAKVSLDLAQQGPAPLVDPDPVEIRETPHRPSAFVSLRRADEIALRKPACDITLIGSAVAPGGAPAESLTSRLGLYRNGVSIIDKTILARADTPIKASPLIWEHALGGADAKQVFAGQRVTDLNPVGTDRPRLVDGGEANRPGGFGPLGATWPCRTSLITASQSRALHSAVPTIPPTFAWSYFQSAPPDQQVPFLDGDEWIVLEGLHERLTSLRVRLPWLRGRAFVASHAGVVPVPFVLDTVAIDAHALRATVLFRGVATPISSLREIAIFAHVCSGGQPPAMPANAAEVFARARPLPLAIPKLPSSPDDTLPQDPSTPTADGAPFPIAAPSSSKRGGLAPWQEVLPYVAPASFTPRTMALNASCLMPPAPSSPAQAYVPPKPEPAIFPDEPEADDVFDRDPTPPPRAVLAAAELRAAGLSEDHVQRIIRDYEALPP